MAIEKSQITHRSERIPEIARREIYTYEDIVYTELYDDVSGALVSGDVKMFGGVSVCTVYKDGSIKITIPTDLAFDHRGLMWLINDLQRLDEFLSAVVTNYH